MESPLIKFYRKIFNLYLLRRMYLSHEYLLPMEVAAFNLATKDFKSGTNRREDEIESKINEEYDNSKIVLQIHLPEYLQEIIHRNGSMVVAKNTYNKIDFLSLLSSFKTFNEQINFIEDVVNFYDGDHIDIRKIGTDISINKIKYSNCQSIKIKKS